MHRVERTMEDIVALAAKVGVTINTETAETWLSNPKAREEMERAVDTHIINCMRWLRR